MSVAMDVVVGRAGVVLVALLLLLLREALELRWRPPLADAVGAAEAAVAEAAGPAAVAAPAAGASLLKNISRLLCNCKETRKAHGQ